MTRALRIVQRNDNERVLDLPQLGNMARVFVDVHAGPFPSCLGQFQPNFVRGVSNEYNRVANRSAFGRDTAEHDVD